MGFLGYDQWDFIWASPILIIALFFHSLWRKFVSKDLTTSMYTIVTSIPKILFVWLYTIILAYIYCKKSGVSFNWKDSWKPMLPIVIYFVIMIILTLLSNHSPVLTTLFSIINFILNNFVVFYLIGALIWYKILKSTYDDCF